MYSVVRRIAALVLAAALLCGTAAAANVCGEPLYSYTLDLCTGTTLTRQVSWNSARKDLCTENYVTCTPSSAVSPAVSYGSTVPARQSVSDMAAELAAGGRRVLGGINGDYFVLATGTPLGMVITDHTLRSSSSYLHAVGFRDDGSAVIGTPELTMRADFAGYSLKITDINKTRSAGAYYLYTRDFGTTTKNTLAGTDVVLRPTGANEGKAVTGMDGAAALTTSSALRVGGYTPCTVVDVLQSEGPADIPAGCFVLSISGKGDSWMQEMLNTLSPGDTVNLEIYSADTRWNEVDCAVGAMYLLMENGQVISNPTNGADTSTAPRTAVGVKPDGAVIFYTIDGRQSGLSIGASAETVGSRLKELGCTDAVLLDGGGSTTLVTTYPDRQKISIANSPSEGSQRAVSNAIFLVSNLSATGTPASLYVTPTDLCLLAGASTQCAAVGMDSGWYPLSTLPGELAWSAEDGTVSGTGVFTAPAETGRYTVTAEAGGVSGSTVVQVYKTPDSIYVRNEATGKNVSSVTLAPGQSLRLSATASYRTVSLKGDDTCFTWSADPAIGTISADGTFTAGDATATGKIKVAAGAYAVTMSVTVKAPSDFRCLADFERSDLPFVSESAALSLSRTDGNVRLGVQSLEFAEAGEDTLLTLREPIAPESNEHLLSLWTKGASAGLSACFVTEDGTELETKFSPSVNSGWTQLWAEIPDNAAFLTGLRVRDAAGTVWLDQLCAANQRAEDTAAPSIELKRSGSAVSAVISDAGSSSLPKEQISLTLDGAAQAFTWDEAAGTLTASLKLDTACAHQITVTAADACGNLARAGTVTSAESTGSGFDDMADTHWAAPYTARLKQAGILTGAQAGDKLNFYPSKAVTRGDFALMVSRWLELDTAAYSDTVLPYRDAAAIPAWDLEAVRALYALGIMQGSRAADGSLYANASSGITRAEAITILGRLQPKGWPAASLSSFSDAGSVPSWASEYAASLVGQKIVSGSDGKLRPNDAISRAEVAKLLFSLW